MYTRRSMAKVSNGIGTWMQCIETLTQLSVITNAATCFFTSEIYLKIFVTKEVETNTMFHWTMIQFLIFVIIIEHLLLILKTFIE